MADRKAANYLAEHGDAVIAMGYNIIPIKRGAKYPPHDNWQKTKATPTWLAKALKEGIKQEKDGEAKTIRIADAGIGILTRNTPGVDIDVSDEAMSKELEDWVMERMGQFAAPVRVGRWPRRLMMFRTDEPFSKVNSNEYLDELGEKQKVEVLADGQQFVAYHIHPDTQKPYEWIYKPSPLTVHANDLPTINRAQAQEIVNEFERLAKARGWKLKSKSRTAPEGRALAIVDEDDPFADVGQKMEVNEGEIHDWLMDVPNCDEYEQWIQIGMALYHQYDGSDEGFELWDEWSSAASNYAPDALHQHWSSFAIENKGRSPLTARIIKKRAEAYRKEQAVEVMAALKTQLEEATSKTLFEEACKSIKKQDMTKLDRAEFAAIVRTTYKRITNIPITIAEAKSLVRYESPDVGKMPKWLEGWVFLSKDDVFYHPASTRERSHNAFNSEFNVHLLSPQEKAEGKAKPERLAADYALNIVQIPRLEGLRYLPTAGPVFNMDDKEGLEYANSYTDKSVPFAPEEIKGRDKVNVNRIVHHFTHLIADRREREFFMDWLAYIVQSGNRPNWCVLLQGSEGDGKSFFEVMMSAVLGHENVQSIAYATLESPFTSWAEGVQLSVVEEVKHRGGGRFDMLEKLKTYITNKRIEVHKKNRSPYQTTNTAAYLLTSNYRDAMPISVGDTRYLILFSRFQNKEHLTKFKEENPYYYSNLFKAVEESPGAIRRWFLNRTFGPEFNPQGRAPESASRNYMVEQGKPLEQIAIEELLEESMEVDVSQTLLNASKLPELMVGRDAELPETQGLNRLLNRMGFTQIGRVKIKGEKQNFWTRYPERFYIEDTTKFDLDKVRQYAATSL